jgi:hypothetical protein
MPEQMLGDKKVEVSYLRLLGIYEGDVLVDPEKKKYVHAFLIHCETVEKQRYICPVYTQPNHYESTKKAIGRLIPLLFAAFDKTIGLVKDEHQEGGAEVSPVVEHVYQEENEKTH